MSFLRKLIGPSRLQEDFKKSISLKWKISVSSNDEIEISINQNKIKKKHNHSCLYFDFEEDVLFIQGDLFNEIINENSFKIIRINKLDEELEIFLSRVGVSNIIVMKCKIYRNYILLEGTLANWYCKVSNNIKITHI